MHRVRAEEKGRNVIFNRDVSNMHNLHKKKLDGMKSTLASLGYNSKPKTIPQVVRANLKKRMFEDERLAEIEAENARLLSSMSKIMDAPDQMTRLNRPAVNSLNVVRRKQEMDRVTTENMRLLRQLEHTPAFYNPKVWEAQRREAEHRLAYIGLYPYKAGRGVLREEPPFPHSDADDAWFRSVTSLSRKSALSLPELSKEVPRDGLRDHGDRGRRSVDWSLPPMHLADETLDAQLSRLGLPPVPIRPDVPPASGQQAAAGPNRRASEPPQLASAAAPGVTAPPKTTDGAVRFSAAASPASTASSRPGSGRLGGIGGGGGTSAAPQPLSGLQPMSSAADANQPSKAPAEANKSAAIASSIPKTEAPLRLDDLELPGVTTTRAAAAAAPSATSPDSCRSSSASADKQSRKETTNIADSTDFDTVRSTTSVGRDIRSAGRRAMVPLPANVCKIESDTESEVDIGTDNLNSVEVSTVSKAANRRDSQNTVDNIIEKGTAENPETDSVHSAIMGEDACGSRDASFPKGYRDSDQPQMEPFSEGAETTNVDRDNSCADHKEHNTKGYPQEGGLPSLAVDSEESESTLAADGGKVSEAQMQTTSSVDSTSVTNETILGCDVSGAADYAPVDSSCVLVASSTGVASFEVVAKDFSTSVFSNPDIFPAQSQGTIPQIFLDTNDEPVSSSPADDTTGKGTVLDLNNHNTVELSGEEASVAAADNDSNGNGTVHVVKDNEDVLASGDEAALRLGNSPLGTGTVLDDDNAAQSVSGGVHSPAEMGGASVENTESSGSQAAADQSGVKVTNSHPSGVHAVDAEATSENGNQGGTNSVADGTLPAVEGSKSSHSGQGEHTVYAEVSNSVVNVMEAAIVGNQGHISSDMEAGMQTAMDVIGVEESIATDLVEENRSTITVQNGATPQEAIEHVAAGNQLSTAQASPKNATIVVAGDPASLGESEST
mmetsp:Transcript_32490/g.67876  ORF Transcript_32490/g.67876 Transcript_32490/m.67876 type:complete len:951 (-) Transcript_32490:173-3025(-)